MQQNEVAALTLTLAFYIAAEGVLELPVFIAIRACRELLGSSPMGSLRSMSPPPPIGSKRVQDASNRSTRAVFTCHRTAPARPASYP